MRVTSWRGLGASLGLAVGIVLFANLAAHSYLVSFPVNRGVSRLWHKWQMVETMQKPVDWLVLGDSSCGQGVRPDILSARLGGTVANLCTIANAGVVNDAWLLDRYIERFGPPKGVIVVHVFHVWERTRNDLVTMLDQIPLSGRFWTRLDPPINLGRAGGLREMLAPALVLYDKNLSVAEVIKTEVERALGFYNRPRSEAWGDLDFVARHDGFVSERVAKPDEVRRELDPNIRAFGHKPFVLDPDNEAAVAAMVRSSRVNGFPIFFSNTSIAQPLYADAGIQRYFRDMHETLAPLMAGSPQAHLILAQPPTFEPDEMDNIDHVVGDAAVGGLSRAVAEAVLDAEADGKSR